MTKLEKFLEEHSDESVQSLGCELCKFANNNTGCDYWPACPKNKDLFEELNKPYKEHIKFTEDEKVILRNADAEYKWIARDKYGLLFIYKEKPSKGTNGWYSCSCLSSSYCLLKPFSHLFQQIKWEDDEPVNFREVLENEKTK